MKSCLSSTNATFSGLMSVWMMSKLFSSLRPCKSRLAMFFSLTKARLQYQIMFRIQISETNEIQNIPYSLLTFLHIWGRIFHILFNVFDSSEIYLYLGERTTLVFSFLHQLVQIRTQQLKHDHVIRRKFEALHVLQDHFLRTVLLH